MTKRRLQPDWLRCAVAASLVALLLSCGGGGGGGEPIFSPGGSAPTVSITSPANLSTGLSGNLVVNASATDDNGVASVEFQVDGVSIGTSTTAPYSATVSTTNYASGQHVVRARAIDGDGNASDFASVTVQFGGTRTQPGEFTRNEAFVSPLNLATAFAQAPDGRLFIAEQGGTLRVVDGTLQATPFVTLAVDSVAERGLLGVALHPDFATNQFIYLYYTTAENGTHNRISRFTANGNVAVVGSEVKLIELPALSGATNHNGGAIHFGIDGKLYVGVGDNNNGANSQDPSTALGKMLRFNDDGSIPNDNPFFSSRAGQARAAWADGLRNPFTFAVQPVTGRIHINDVGQDTWEEINVGAAGANYGWPSSEGPDNVGPGVTAPLFTYKHSAAVPAGSGPGGFFVGFSIVGGTFYPSGGSFGPPFQGGYFFADHSNQFIGFLDLAHGNAAYTFGSVSSLPVDMLVAGDGALLVLTRSNVVRFSKP